MSAAWHRFVEVAAPQGGAVVAIAEIYFDETGTHDGSPVMGVAGYVFTKSNARKFTQKWNAHLRTQGIPFFHMSDCAPSPGNAHYKGWSPERRDNHERALIRLIKETSSFGFAECCTVEGYRNLSGNGLASRYDAYSFMLATAVNAACHYLRSKSFKGRASFFFESGHRYQGEARELIERLTKEFPEKYFNPNFAFVQKADAPPLQAADLLAWLSRNALMKSLDGKAVRRDFVALASDGHRIKYYNESDIKRASDIYSGRALGPRSWSYPIARLPE